MAAFSFTFRSSITALILGTVRSEEIQPALTRLVQQLHATENVTEIELQPLDASETAKLAGQTPEKNLVYLKRCGFTARPKEIHYSSSK